MNMSNLTINKGMERFPKYGCIRQAFNYSYDFKKLDRCRWNGTYRELCRDMENYVIKSDTSKITWREIIKSENTDKLSTAYKKDTDGTLHYYKYSVTERNRRIYNYNRNF